MNKAVISFLHIALLQVDALLVMVHQLLHFLGEEAFRLLWNPVLHCSFNLPSEAKFTVPQVIMHYDMRKTLPDIRTRSISEQSNQSIFCDQDKAPCLRGLVCATLVVNQIEFRQLHLFFPL